jgi:hypothetical protein
VALWDKDPLAPVTVIEYGPAGVLVVVEIVSVLVYVGVPLVGLTVAVRPVAAGLMLVLSETVAAVPLTRLTVTVEVVPDPWTTDPLVGLRLTLKSNVPEALNDPICPMTVFQFWNVESMRYSPATQKVEDDVGVGSVAAPK